MVSMVFSYTILIRRTIAAEALPILTFSSAEVAGDVGPKIGEVLHHVEGAVTYGDAGSGANVLAQDVSLFDADLQAKL